MNAELVAVAQSKEDRKAAIAEARKAHHATMISDGKKRVDAYVNSSTKDGLAAIKACFDDVSNEGQAIDRAVELALKSIKKAAKE